MFQRCSSASPRLELRAADLRPDAVTFSACVGDWRCASLVLREMPPGLTLAKLPLFFLGGVGGWVWWGFAKRLFLLDCLFYFYFFKETPNSLIWGHPVTSDL